MKKTTCTQRRLFIAAAVGITLSTQAVVGQTAPSAMATVPTGELEDTGWVTSAALGLTLTRGNSKTLVGTGNILSEKKWDANEVRLGLDANYGEDDGDKNAESIHGFGQYNRLFTDRAYGYVRVDALHDAVADIEYRVTISPGLGYYFVKSPQNTWAGEFGPAVIMEKQGDNSREYLSLRLAERSEHKLNDRVRVWQMVEFLPQVDNFENFIVNAEAGIDTSLTEKLSLTVFAIDTYDNEPAPGRKENDLKLVTGVKYKF